MDITFILCPNIIGVLGLAILLVFTRFNFYLEEKTLKLFRMAAIVNLVIIVFEVTDYLLGETPFPAAYLVRRFTSATGFALSPIFPLLLARITSRTKLPPWLFLPATINVFLSYGSMFTGHMFWIDEWNSYFRGPLFAVMLVISIFYLGVLMFIAFKTLQSVRSSEASFLICIIAMIFIGNLLEIFLSFHFLIWNSCAILLICYYLYLHIQYFKYDPLTKVFNRNMFSAELSNMAHRENIGILSFDLDHLKEINDRNGHEQGDAYIVTAAKLIDQCFSNAGRLFRVGGDEFVVLMAGTNETAIQDKIERFHKVCLQNGISVSCGYAFHPAADDLAKMLRDADQAMYANKRERQSNR